MVKDGGLEPYGYARLEYRGQTLIWSMKRAPQGFFGVYSLNKHEPNSLLTSFESREL
ncbi:MAG: hypothetical protein Ct9H300mP11_10390 [Chloroflexota bacterium]|nr:MAG: hypothetical protein Ct9H300mP11_10390 [Chloroflexota bacterium]